MIAHWIGYVVLVLVLVVLKAAIDDGARDRRLACALCALLLVALVAALVLRGLS